MSAWPPRLYELRQSFRAPMPYVFRWLTDYSSRDPDLEKGSYQRKVIEKSRTRAVLEDLTETKTGWEWYRSVVTLHPPDRWHAELRGNVPDWSLDYRLTAPTPDRTLLTIRWRMRQNRKFPHHAIPPRAATERMMRGLWKNFANSLDREYRRQLRDRPRRRTR
ncbi:MAG: hypothetical protein WCB18_09565 [Thermoplasmata archaeon]